MRGSDEGTAATEAGWRWDSSLYSGSADHYAQGRAAYPATLIDRLVALLHLDETQTVIDVGCGPGSLTLPLARHAHRVIGVDADQAMLVTAARLAAESEILNARWRCLRAEEFPADLPAADVITFAQSLHWMDRSSVLSAVRTMLRPGGVVVHVSATTHRGDAAPGRDIPERKHLVSPPWDAIAALTRSYLGTRPRAGQSYLPASTGGGETRAFEAAGFYGPERSLVPGWTVHRSEEQVFSAVHSLSGAAPHLFGSRLDDFDADLRKLLAGSSRQGGFVEFMRAAVIDIWRPAIP